MWMFTKNECITNQKPGIDWVLGIYFADGKGKRAQRPMSIQNRFYNVQLGVFIAEKRSNRNNS